ncbi:POU domain, class 6, transcription factor 1, variant 2 [Clonorchis sinensis]|nr:POU domain, class 6, transcription factor 1, variant 2 [Clonorchis sinensis]
MVTLDYEVSDKTSFQFGVENGPSQKAHSSHQNGTSFPERSPAKPEAMQVLSFVEQPLDATLPRLQPQNDTNGLPKVALDPSKTVDTSVLNQLVCQLLEQNGCSMKAPTSTPPTSATNAEDLVLSGHNLSALARFVHRLRQYRLRAGLSQSELSAELARHFNNETMFSQSLLSRFERLEVNVRAAFRLLPYLESWLSHTEQKGCSMMSSELIQPDITFGKRVSGRTRTTQLIRLGSISSNPACSSDQRPQSPVESSITEAAPHAIAMFSQSSEKGFDSASADIVLTSTCQLKNPECRTKRRKRTHFSDSVLTILSETYKEDPRPEGAKLTRLAMETGYDREAIRVWFCNRRQVSARTEKVST